MPPTNVWTQRPIIERLTMGILLNAPSRLLQGRLVPYVRLAMNRFHNAP